MNINEVIKQVHRLLSKPYPSEDVCAAILNADAAMCNAMFPEPEDALNAEFVLDDVLDADEIG